MSIIIVGVGEEDFSAMEALDADRMALASQGQVTAVHPPPLWERV